MSEPSEHPEVLDPTSNPPQLTPTSSPLTWPLPPLLALPLPQGDPWEDQTNVRPLNCKVFARGHRQLIRTAVCAFAVKAQTTINQGFLERS